jgi:cytosine/adenosine deaminase-related metal-dependent hydrolase
MFLKAVSDFGGFDNAHGHLCRADTIDDKYLVHMNTTPLEAAAMPLSAKQNMVGNLHEGVGYTAEDARTRMGGVVERLIGYGTTRFSTCIDATPDIGEDGLLVYNIAKELRAKYAPQIVLELGPTPIFGFKEGTDRWKVFETAAREGADFLAALPEKDDYTNRHDRDGKIGYRQHLREVIGLARELHLPVQIHIDQANSADERGTETLIEGLQGWVEQPEVSGYKGPTIWLIHMISPSCYDEKRYARLLDALVDLNIGIIVCPTAAISMRQLRPTMSPTHNSLARVLEICKRGIPVLFGSDNICDMFVPQSNGDMLTEILMLSHGIRFPIPHVLAKMAAGVPLNDVDRVTIGDFLHQDNKAFLRVDAGWDPAVG